MKKIFNVFSIFFLIVAVSACKEEEATPQPISKTDDYGKAIIKVVQITTEFESLVREQCAYSNTFLNCAKLTYKNIDDALETSIFCRHAVLRWQSSIG